MIKNLVVVASINRYMNKRIRKKNLVSSYISDNKKKKITLSRSKIKSKNKKMYKKVKWKKDLIFYSLGKSKMRSSSDSIESKESSDESREKIDLALKKKKGNNERS